jgi:phage terminase large subunit GpA-like protein
VPGLAGLGDFQAVHRESPGPEVSCEEDKIPEGDKIYAAHLAAEVKERNKRGQLVWTLRHGRDNHLLDCEVMAMAAAEAFNVYLLPRPNQHGQEKKQGQEVNRFTGQPRGSWLRR